MHHHATRCNHGHKHDSAGSAGYCHDVNQPRAFLEQALLHSWADSEQVRVDGEVLTFVAEQRTLQLTQAVRFVGLIDGTNDPHALVGKVKTLVQLQQLGAEHYMDSVICGDIGYTVVEGYVGDLSPAPSLQTNTPAPTVVMGEPSVGEAEALSQLFLKTVRDR
jgi:hypothetical protein